MKVDDGDDPTVSLSRELGRHPPSNDTLPTDHDGRTYELSTGETSHASRGRQSGFSEPGDEPTFSFALDAEWPAVSTQSRSGKSVDILLVEDNPGDVRLTREAFKEGQIRNTLHVTTDGIEALDFLHRRGEYTDAPALDIVLLDLNLPRKDGDEVLEEIRNDPELERLPVIILTSSSAEEDIVKSYDLQANAFLTKPVDPAEFIEVVKSFQHFWLSVVRLPPRDEYDDR